MSSWKYMPILKWKRGEQDALRYLGEENWNDIAPLIEIQPNLGKSPGGVVDEVVGQLSKAVPSGKQVLIDTVYLAAAGVNQLDFVSWFAYSLQAALPDRKILPVVHSTLGGTFSSASTKVKNRFQSLGGLVLRFRTDLGTHLDLGGYFGEVGNLGVSGADAHVLIDQFSLVGSDVSVATSRLLPYLNAASTLGAASVTVSGGSFPVDLVGFKAGVCDIRRIEWDIWSQLVLKGVTEGVRFSDYAVTNPHPLAEIDPTQVNPSISIRYAANGFWRLFKGSGFKGAAPGTLKGLCQLLTSDSIYGGAHFSYGDNNYDLISKSSKTTNGVPWTWRRDATNRHLVQTLKSL